MIRNDSAAFLIDPVSGWENELKWGLDSMIYLKYRFWYIFNIRSGILTMTESEMELPDDMKTVPVSEMKIITKDLLYKDFGIDLNVIAPATKRERIKELSQLRGNQEYRNAIIETIADYLTDAEINRIISEINDYINSLDDYDRLLKKKSAEITIVRLLAIK